MMGIRRAISLLLVLVFIGSLVFIGYRWGKGDDVLAPIVGTVGLLIIITVVGRDDP
jgi:hypothetical protein